PGGHPLQAGFRPARSPGDGPGHRHHLRHPRDRHPLRQIFSAFPPGSAAGTGDHRRSGSAREGMVRKGGGSLKQARISEAVIRRLPVYLRFLTELMKAGVQTVSSQELGERLSLNPAQIRKDLAYFGEFGRKGIGYNVPYLVEKIRQILHLDRTVYAALVGTGNLGRALCNYRVYLEENVKIVALFDADPAIVGTTINHLKVQPME